MLYYIIRPIIRFALKIFFRKIYLSNLQNIPAGKPVILAANHPTAFLEPCILACFQNRGLYYLVRGDIFVRKFYIRLLGSLHMLPVYRKKDRGYKFIKQNYSTFSTCHQTLAQKRMVMILAEGSCEHEKRLRPLMKGTARIAFGTLEEYPDIEDVYIVPVGVNYTYAERFRSEVYIDFGEPIPARSFEKVYRENPNQGINDLTDKIRDNLLPRVIHIEQAADDALVEKLFRFDRSRQKFSILPIVSSDDKPLQREKRLADWVNQLTSEKKKLLKEKTAVYVDLLKETGLDHCTRVEKSGNSIMLSLFFIIGFPFFLTGFIFGYPPMFLAAFVTHKRVKDITFRSSILMAVGVAAWILYLLIILIVGLVLKVYFLFLLPVLGLFALFYMDLYDSWTCRRKYRQMPLKEKKALGEAREALEAMIKL